MCIMFAAALSDGDYPHAAILHSDVCLLVGHDVVEKPPFFMSATSKKIVGTLYVIPSIVIHASPGSLTRELQVGGKAALQDEHHRVATLP